MHASPAATMGNGQDPNFGSKHEVSGSIPWMGMGGVLHPALAHMPMEMEGVYFVIRFLQPGHARHVQP